MENIVILWTLFTLHFISILQFKEGCKKNSVSQKAGIKRNYLKFGKMFENTCKGVYFKFSWFGADKFFEKETFSRVFKKF